MIKFFGIVIYIFFILSVVGPIYSFLTLQPKRAQEFWSRLAVKTLRLQFRYLPNSQQVQTNKRTMLLFNHRTQGDFFIHDVVSQYSANFLARWMVAVAFPMLFIFQQLFTQSVWFFRRGGNDLNNFFKWIDNKFDKATRPNLLVYPEGHRMHESDKVGKMKTGMLQYAYDRKIDTQIIIVLGIEKAFNEKKFHASLGPTQIAIKVDEIIKPDKFATFELFIEHIQAMFKKNFEETYDYQYKKS
ncbi:unnamed protein product [Paramecium primaurelia]|uniref:Phospholipid/glycerol acyltransferase domain-containing protein n=2 Tax=Paramecium TaxID=5884 RepID=A0A8S1X7P2_9CILI|nr:unnamed protein product [Paramecium primaurelia]CAD8197185.1 unnamed protein product [Paramecium pentaurelia]